MELKNTYYERQNNNRRVTEPHKNFKKVNPFYASLLHDHSSCNRKYVEIFSCFLNMIIGNIFYKDYKISSCSVKRSIIHACHPLTVKEMLMETRPMDYPDFDSKKLEHDATNMRKVIKEAKGLNIFYIFDCMGFYMPVMERDFSIWKTKNPNGVVVPYSVVKVLSNYDLMLEDMSGIIKKQKGILVKEETLHGKFVELVDEQLIGCMDKKIQSKYPKHKECKDLDDYVSKIIEISKGFDKYCGNKFKEELYDNLPPSVICKYNRLEHNEEIIILKKDKKTKKKGKEMESTLANIIPKNKNLVRKRNTKKTKAVKKVKSVNANKVLLPNRLDFSGNINPLKNEKELIIYYKSFLSIEFKGAKRRFYPFASEVKYASKVLDDLLEVKPKKKFLDAWIRYYCKHRIITDKNLTNKNKTSLETFEKTFSDYRRVYRG